VLAEGWSRREAAEALGVSLRTVHKWIVRFQQEGEGGLRDRSSRPHCIPRGHPQAVAELVVALRRQHRLSAVQLAHAVGLPRATVGRILRRHRLSRWRDLEPRPPARRYEYERPGGLLHLDIKKLGRIDGVGHRIHGDRRTRARGVGWEFAHVAVDDCSRLAYVEVLSDERAITTAGFLERALAWLGERGITVRRVLTDNGSAYVSALFADLCRRRDLRHRRTRPYRPRTNGKAERFIQTSLREWAYARPYSSSTKRSAALPRWLHYYNHHRPHAALGGRSPADRVNNVLSTDT
jgi:transposase InsO family protein